MAIRYILLGQILKLSEPCPRAIDLKLDTLGGCWVYTLGLKCVYF